MGGEVQDQTRQCGESELNCPNSPLPDNGSAQHSTGPSSVSISQLSWPSSLDLSGQVDSSANQDLLEFARRLEREWEEKSRALEEKSLIFEELSRTMQDQSRMLEDKSQKLEDKSRKCNLLEAAEVKSAMAIAEAEALRETVQVLQVRNPEAHTLWRSLANKLRRPALVNESQRKRMEALRKLLYRKRRSEVLPGGVVKGYTRILQNKMESLCEPGGKLLLCMDSNAWRWRKAASAGQPDGEQACKKWTWSTRKVAGRKVLLSQST